jgi:hypothetical protein
MTRKHDKMYVIRKYVKASSVAEALRKELSAKPHEVFVDEEWRKANTDRLADAIGFMRAPNEEVE